MYRLLLIDDDEALAPPLKQYLARFDFELSAVPRPSEALKRLAAERFDALILDGMLPEMDGFEFCRRLRSGSDPWHDMPVLMLTARGADGIKPRVQHLRGGGAIEALACQQAFEIRQRRLHRSTLRLDLAKQRGQQFLLGGSQVELAGGAADDVVEESGVLTVMMAAEMMAESVMAMVATKGIEGVHEAHGISCLCFAEQDLVQRFP